MAGNLFVPYEGHNNTPTQISIGTTSAHVSYNVEPDTVSQFTGQYDKNKNRIFDGDILIEHNVFPETSYDMIILIYHTKAGCLAWTDGLSYDCPVFDIECGMNLDRFEVIGNIWDTPPIIGRTLEKISKDKNQNKKSK